MILCDIGNSTFHFYLNGVHKKYFLSEDIPSFEDELYFISVNQKATEKLLAKNKKAMNLEQYIDFTTTYEGMGLDRKLACCFQKDSIIVDCGSAITIDILENYVHKGGFILPGIRNFLKTYSQISQKLNYDFEKDVNLGKMPLQTKDAISYGILKAIISPIKDISIGKKLIFAGGDGEYLSGFFENSIYKKDLIFENMKRIIDANNSLAKR